jgi:drug/metabolite transporter (DMT)-like permease
MQGKRMPVKLLIIMVTVNTVISHMLLKRAILHIGSPGSFSNLPEFIRAAASSPWVYGSLTLQVLGYVLWMVVISHEKLGVATASVGASYYILTSAAAWMIYGETLAGMQWVGILLITAGVVCVSLGQA